LTNKTGEQYKNVDRYHRDTCPTDSQRSQDMTISQRCYRWL